MTFRCIDCAHMIPLDKYNYKCRICVEGTWTPELIKQDDEQFSDYRGNVCVFKKKGELDFLEPMGF